MMETERILLRPWRDNDAAALFKYASDPDVGPRAGWPPHKSVEESLEIIHTVFHNDTNWAIELKETGEAIGAIGYLPAPKSELPVREGEPLVGYWVGKPYWKRCLHRSARVNARPYPQDHRHQVADQQPLLRQSILGPGYGEMRFQTHRRVLHRRKTDGHDKTDTSDAMGETPLNFINAIP